MIEKLEKKIEGRKDNVITATLEKIEDTSTDKIISEIKRNYRLINNCDRRIESKLIYIEQKQNMIIKALKDFGVDLSKIEELEKQEKINKLENKLKRLKSEG